jgi:oxaloacetate decarboxylase beta subunit
MTDFSCMLANPRLVLLGAAAQSGIFLTFMGAMALGFEFQEAAAIGIIGGADGPTAIFLSSKMAPHLLGAIAVSAYSYMALVPVIQPPIIKLLTSRKERLIRMKPSKPVSKRLRILFPIISFLITAFIAPGSLNLLGFLFFGNLLKECGVTERLAQTARTAFIDIITILLGLTVGASTDASRFLTPASIKIFALGAASFAVATASGVMFAKLMNWLSGGKINPIIGAAGVSAVPDSARVCQMVGAREDPQNYLIMHAMAPNVAGVIGSAVAAGVLLATF